MRGKEMDILKKIDNILNEGSTKNELGFGEFIYYLPWNKDDAEKNYHSLGASGMEAYIEQILSDHRKDKDVIEDAFILYKQEMKRGLAYLKTLNLDNKIYNIYASSLQDIYDWLNRGWGRSLRWNDKIKQWEEI